MGNHLGSYSLPSSAPRRAQVAGGGREEEDEDKEDILLPSIQSKGPVFSS